MPSPASAPFAGARAPYLDGHVQTGRLVGAVTVALRSTGIIDIGCCGMRNLSSREPTTEDTIFRLHSMSKALTVVGLLMLCDEGLCTLDTPASEFVPELARLRAHDWQAGQAHPALTLRHLLTHTAGLPYPDPLGPPAERSLARAIGDMMTEPHGLSLAEWTVRVSDACLAHAPGAGFRYGISIDVLGGIIEAIAGKPLDTFLDERVFAPLGMRDTGFHLSAAQRERLARVYRVGQHGDFLEVPEWLEEPRFLSAGGKLFSTARDYAHFCQMLLLGGVWGSTRLLKPETVAAIATCQLGHLRERSEIRHHPDLGPGASFGLLGRVVLEPRESGYGTAGTFGWDGVCGNTFFVDRNTDLSGVLLTQILPWPEALHQDFRRWIYAQHT